MSIHENLREGSRFVFAHVERQFDAAFGPADNPLRHLGAMGLFFLWVLVATGIYLFIVVDTSVEGAFTSIGYLSEQQWYFGGIVRSLHRYATDGFVIVVFLHLVREWAYDHYSGFRLYTWVTGVPLIWLLYISAIGGYWIVWDQLSNFSAVATMELFDWSGISAPSAARNFLTPEAVTDRLFTFLVYVHIGVPVFLILGAWAHLNRISGVDHIPSRRLALGTSLSLLFLSLIHPAVSNAQADMTLVPAETKVDWFVLFLHPLTYATSAGFVWFLLLGVTLLLFLLPLFPHARQGQVAKVDPPNCNGCRRCYADCPYAAITMAPHPDRPKYQIAVVDPDNCASCGICVGSCPASTPFRSVEELVTGIDMPGQPIGALRRALEHRLAGLRGSVRIVVFGCDKGVKVDSLEGEGVAAFSLTCTGMLPPSFIEYALRGGADGVVITGCCSGGCDFRFGNRWTEERLDHVREPHLRPRVPRERMRVVWADAVDAAALKTELHEFKMHLQTLTDGASRPLPFYRRTLHHEG